MGGDSCQEIMGSNRSTVCVLDGHFHIRLVQKLFILEGSKINVKEARGSLNIAALYRTSPDAAMHTILAVHKEHFRRR